MNVSDAVYGLRNLMIGDDEETRIADEVYSIADLNVMARVKQHLDKNEYCLAYAVAIKSVLDPFTLAERVAFIKAWVLLWNADMRIEDEDEDEVTADELITLYNELKI